ncbi:glycosyltransferase family 4 protein [Cellulomonas sp. H30R-01]|uniref:glycosyltransferase n=1 Tax=Cellulomonas sp. H30R-01 TaxID=2704467 RepID=UPI00138D454F|nr:glycosyltransferase [Cellulomonas sp. H30R-01]QHT56879.1 glycosyltransferase family 4 protein [Cellulomonas sp. H30R-01]
MSGLRVLVDGRLLAPGHSGVRDVAVGLVDALRATAGPGQELLVAGRGPAYDVDVAGPGFMHLQLPRAALATRSDVVLVPRQARPLLSPVPVVPVFHDVGFLRARAMYRSSWPVRAADRSARWSRRGLAVSEFTVDEVVAARSRVALRALPLGALHPVRWQPHEDDPYVLCVAVQEPHKNLERLVRAWGEARPAGVRLVLCGRAGEATEGIRRALAGLGPEVAVECVAGLADDEYARLLEGCTAYVQPSFYEGLCIPALDLAAAGAPTVVGRAGNLGRVFAGAPEHATVDPSSIGDLAGALRAVVGDAGVRRALSDWNRAHVTLTDWDEVGRAAWSVLAAAAGGRRGRTRAAR